MAPSSDVQITSSLMGGTAFPPYLGNPAFRGYPMMHDPTPALRQLSEYAKPHIGGGKICRLCLQISKGVLLFKELSGMISYGRQRAQKEKVTHYNGKGRKIPFISCLIATVLFSAAQSTFVEFPKNAVVLEGKPPKTIDMSCKSDCPCKLSWFMQKNPDSERESLFNGYFLRQGADSYSTVIADKPGKYSLRLNNLPGAAQTYICVEPGTLAETSADLIWLSKLVCYDSSTEDLVNLTCSIEFRGNWAPIMEWKEYSSYGEKVLSNGISTATVPNQLVTSTLVMVVEDGSGNYMCTPKFDISGKPRHTTATNIPDCNLLWTTSVLSKAPDESLPTQIVVTTIIAALIATTAILILLVIFLKNKKPRKDESQQTDNENQQTDNENQQTDNENQQKDNENQQTVNENQQKEDENQQKESLAKLSSQHLLEGNLMSWSQNQKKHGWAASELDILQREALITCARSVNLNRRMETRLGAH